MNGNIVNQLTDPQNNKEQFVHEMTEVYLLLNEELKNFNIYVVKCAGNYLLKRRNIT